MSSEPDHWEQHIDCRIPAQQVEAVDELVKSGHYLNRSEAIREAVRLLVRHHPESCSRALHPKTRQRGRPDE